MAVTNGRQHMFGPALVICIVATWWLTHSWIVAVPGIMGVMSMAWSRRGSLDAIGQLIAAMLGLAIVYATFFVWL
ncbi:MAG: hypothetical protein JXX14_02290, partial [Deltaproteobacteria bacterium]|nr:hypothetical protein [Deltaproteobacteria bacterium]